MRVPYHYQICNIVDFYHGSGDRLSCVKHFFDAFRAQMDAISQLSALCEWFACTVFPYKKVDLTWTQYALTMAGFQICSNVAVTFV